MIMNMKQQQLITVVAPPASTTVSVVPNLDATESIELVAFDPVDPEPIVPEPVESVDVFVSLVEVVPVLEQFCTTVIPFIVAAAPAV